MFLKKFLGEAIVFLFLKKFLEGELWGKSRYYFSKKELSQNISPYMVKITKKKFLKKLKKSVDNILKVCYYRLNGNESKPRKKH